MSKIMSSTCGRKYNRVNPTGLYWSGNYDLSLTIIKFWPCELRTTTQDTILWAATHEDTDSSLRFSQGTTHKTSIWLELQVTGKQEEEGRKGKRRNDQWALALLEEALALHSHLSSVKCVGKTFTTSVALLRVSSHLQQSPHEQHVKNELGWPLPWPSTSSSLVKSREFGLQYILPASSHPGSWGVEFHLFLS